MLRMRRACMVMKKGGATVCASPDATSGGGGSGNPRPRSGELAPHGWRGGRALGEGVGGGATPKGVCGWQVTSRDRGAAIIPQAVTPRTETAPRSGTHKPHGRGGTGAGEPPPCVRVPDEP